MRHKTITALLILLAQPALAQENDIAYKLGADRGYMVVWDSFQCGGEFDPAKRREIVDALSQEISIKRSFGVGYMYAIERILKYAPDKQAVCNTIKLQRSELFD